MSNNESHWFHCGNCGQLYSDEVDFSEDRKCPHCGEFPAPQLEVLEKAPPVEYGMTDPKPVMAEMKYQGRGHRRRRLGLASKVVLAWLVLLLVIYGLTKWQQNSSSSSVDELQILGNPERQGTESHEHQQLIDQALPECRVTLERFLSAESVAERLPLVLSGPDQTQSMERFYAEQEPLEIKPESLKLIASTVVNLPEGEAILTHWENDEAASFDAAFRLQEDRWLLDWEHFVRIGDMPWAQFLAGSGPDVAEFRLHARRRMATDDDPANSIGVVLSAPMRRQLDVVGYDAPMAGIPLSEVDGQLLQSAFEKDEQGTPLFGAAWRDLNPDGMIRVRVRAQRYNRDGVYSYGIVKVLACHWYRSAATGLE